MVSGGRASQRTRGWRYRGNVAARALAGVVGGYAVAALAVMMLARLLPADRIEATIAATLLGFVGMPATTIGAFLVRKPWHAWAGLSGVAALCSGAIWLTAAARP